MRDFITIVESAIAPAQNEARAQHIFDTMSPLARYRLLDRLPYMAGWKNRSGAAVRYIAHHLGEFNKKARG